MKRITVPLALVAVLGLSGCELANRQSDITSLVMSNTTFVPSFCPPPWIGEAGGFGYDYTGANSLLGSLNPAYVRISVDWSIGVTNWSYVDRYVGAQRGRKMILGIFNTNVVVYSNALTACIGRYRSEIWGVSAYNEPDALPSYTNGNPHGPAADYAPYVTTARYVIDHLGYQGKIKLIGPCLSYDYVDGYCSNLYALGVLSNLDVIASHDYFACPGNGCCTTNMCSSDGTCTNLCPGPIQPTNYVHCCSYFHPTDSPDPTQNYPNLAGRIQNMRYWASVAGASSTVFLEEYCLYCGNVNDAILTAQILSANQPAILMFSWPISSVGPGGCPNSNALVSGTNLYWDAAMKAFMNTTCNGSQ